MNANTLDIVTPLLRSDFDRYKMQLRTLQEFWKIPGKFHVLVHRTEAGPWLDELASFDSRIELHFQEDMITPLAVNLSGWYVQQLAKLAAADLVQSEAYLCLDADTVLGRAVALDVLIPNGKPLYNCTPFSRNCSHINYITQSALMLQYPLNDLQYMSEWSTKIMRVDVVRQLCARIETLTAVTWDTALVQHFLTHGRAWGEYLMYHVELERTAILESAHTLVSASLNGSYFWDKGHHKQWHLMLQGAGPFVLCGSKAGLSAHWVRDQLAQKFPFLRELRFTTDV